jgi:hypothetical protein
MFRTRKNLFQLLPRPWFITMAEDLSQGILRATIPCFGLWQIVPNVLSFPWQLPPHGYPSLQAEGVKLSVTRADINHPIRHDG